MIGIKYKTIAWLFLIFLVLHIADLTLTYMIFQKSGHNLAESNPIMILLQNNFLFFLLQIVFVIMIYWGLITIKEPRGLYMMLCLMLFLDVLKLFAVVNNAIVYQAPLTFEQANQITAQAKTAAYAKIMAWFIIIPYILNWLIFKLFNKEVDIKFKNG